VREGGPVLDGPLGYRPGATPPGPGRVGLRLAAAVLGSAVALAAPAGLLPVLAAALAGAYRALGLGAGDLWRDARWLVFQALGLVALHGLLRGIGALATGAEVGARVALAFLPGALLLRTTPTGALAGALERVLPERLAFALSAGLRFAPLLVREAQDVVRVQRLRGARLGARDLWRPAAWRDWTHCVGVPVAVRVLHLAGEAALAARARGLDARAEERR